MIRKATFHDIDRIEEIYNEIHDEIESGRAQIGWIRGVYPTRDTAMNSIRLREMYVMERNGRIVAAGRINQCQGPEYDEASWSFPAAPDDVLVLHTLVVSPREKGRGYGEAFARFYENLARDMGCRALRIDTNAINTPARALYKKLGYTEACIIPTEFNGIRNVNLVCLDKPVSPVSISEIARSMAAYPGNTLHDVDHFIKVQSWARIIGQGEGLDATSLRILEIAAIVHDIACPLCREKYGGAPAKKQEEEGEILAREFLQNSGLTADEIDRICFLVSRHHTLAGVQGMDWQILLEADYIVNAGESRYSHENMENFVSRIFKTQTGKQIMGTLYGI